MRASGVRILVGDGGEELPLLGELALELRGHPIDGRGEDQHFSVMAPGDADPRVELARADVVGDAGELGERAGEPSGDEARRAPHDEERQAEAEEQAALGEFEALGAERHLAELRPFAAHVDVERRALACAHLVEDDAVRGGDPHLDGEVLGQALGELRALVGVVPGALEAATQERLEAAKLRGPAVLTARREHHHRADDGAGDEDGRAEPGEDAALEPRADIVDDGVSHFACASVART